MNKFNWHSEPLSLSTPIDKNYKMSQNVRRFFKAHLGDDFHFNKPFMIWMKESTGKTLADAIEEFKKRKLT
jgi:hypothetical protein